MSALVPVCLAFVHTLLRHRPMIYVYCIKTHYLHPTTNIHKGEVNRDAILKVKCRIYFNLVVSVQVSLVNTRQ